MSQTDTTEALDALIEKYAKPIYGQLASIPDSILRQQFREFADEVLATTRAPGEGEPVASIKSIDEYGPCIDWYKHWVDVGIGTKLYTAPPALAAPSYAQPAPAPRADLVDLALQTYRAAAHEDDGIEGFDERKAMAAVVAALSEAPAKPLPPTRTALIAALRQHYQHARDTHHFKAAYTIEDVITALSEAPREAEGWPKAPKFKFGERVTKTKGSSWTGLVCGFYSTELTLNGYCVESENEPGSVQLYPVAALSAAPKREG